MTPSIASESVGKRPAPTKLPRLPNNARIQKRPIVRPPIPSPYTNASQQKVVYISTHTPFIPTVKRVRNLLEQADKRAVGPLNLLQGKGSDKQKLRKLTQDLEEGKAKKPEEVVLKGTGRAIERVLGMGLYFQQQPDCVVRVRTGGVGVVDDIVEGEGGGEGEEEVPESRVRKTSVVEVGVTLNR